METGHQKYAKRKKLILKLPSFRIPSYPHKKMMQDEIPPCITRFSDKPYIF